MSISAVSGLGFNNYNSISFEGTGVKKARREANTEARQLQTQTPIAEQAPVTNPGKNMVTVPVATLMALLTVATPAIMSPQKAAAQANTGAGAATTHVMVNPEDDTPDIRINTPVIFSDGNGGFTQITLHNGLGNKYNDVFHYATLHTLANDGVISGNVISFNSREKYLIMKFDETERTFRVSTEGYLDTQRALDYIERAYESDANHSRLVNENARQ